MLDELAAARAGNRSFVVREAIQLYASIEAALEEVEETLAFLRMMDRSAEDIRAGRLFTHAAVRRRLTKRKS